MKDLLTRALEAHGGLSRWRKIEAFQFKVSIGGGLWWLKGLGALKRAFLSEVCRLDGGAWGRLARRRHADASLLRARYRLANARSEKTCAPFLAMPR